MMKTDQYVSELTYDVGELDCELGWNFAELIKREITVEHVGASH